MGTKKMVYFFHPTGSIERVRIMVLFYRGETYQ